MAANKKPRGFGRFEQALRTVVSIDKADVEKRADREKKKRGRRRKNS
jgi:hypothetical protein